MKRAFFDALDGQIHYRFAGTGDPPLFLLHSTPLSSFEYLSMIPFLAEKRQVVAMDTIGYGDSDKPSKGKWYTIEDYARTALMLADSLGIEKVVLVGHHSGSKIAIEMAAAYSERVDRVVLLGPYFWETPEWWSKQGLSQEDLWMESELKEDGSHLIDLWRRQSLGMECVGLRVKQRLLLDILKGEDMCHRGHWASAKYAQGKRLPLIKCPTLVVWGSEDVVLHSRMGFHRRNLAEAIPNHRVVEIQGGKFNITLQIPNEVSRLILEFLES